MTTSASKYIQNFQNFFSEMRILRRSKHSQRVPLECTEEMMSLAVLLFFMWSEMQRLWLATMHQCRIFSKTAIRHIRRIPFKSLYSQGIRPWWIYNCTLLWIAFLWSPQCLWENYVERKYHKGMRHAHSCWSQGPVPTSPCSTKDSIFTACQLTHTNDPES